MWQITRTMASLGVHRKTDRKYRQQDEALPRDGKKSSMTKITNYMYIDYILYVMVLVGLCGRVRLLAVCVHICVHAV